MAGSLVACAEEPGKSPTDDTEDETGETDEGDDDAKPLDAGRKDASTPKPVPDASRPPSDGGGVVRRDGGSTADASVGALDAGSKDAGANKCEKVACMSPLDCVFNLDKLECGFTACTNGFCAK